MKRIRQGKVIEIAGVSIIPVERIVINGGCHPHGITISAECVPVGIILDDGEMRWAIGMDGKSIDPDELESVNSHRYQR